jgi:hypothetical protein
MHAAMDAGLEKTSFVKHFPWPFWALPPGPGKASSSSTPQISIHHPRNENMKIRLCN